MRSKIKLQMAERVKQMKPGGQITLKNEKERAACFSVVRELGSVINFRVITSANGDGTFSAVAVKERTK